MSLRKVLLLVAPLLPFAAPEPAAGGGDTCFGKPATISSYEELILGTGGPDVIVGNAKRNDILGGNGDDVICGLGGGDHIDGGSGDDKLGGGPGTDSIEGRRGNDKIFGGPGHDTCNQHELATTGSGGGSASKGTKSCELII